MKNKRRANTPSKNLDIPFSKLALGGKFMYIPSIKDHERVYVKISNDRTGGCIAEWDDKNIATGWTMQGVYSLNETGNDINIRVVV